MMLFAADKSRDPAPEALATAGRLAQPAADRWVHILRPKYAVSTLTLCLGVALFAFNTFLVSTALPSAVAELDGASLISWSTSLYLIFAILGGSAAAQIQARRGPRAALVASSIVFLAGTLLAAAARGMPQLLAGRVLQGLGEGIIAAICYALIPRIFPSGLVQKVFGAEAIVWAVAAFGGPVIAGYLTETASWRMAFLVNAPASLIFMFLAVIVAPSRGESGDRARLPVAPLALIAAGMLFITFAGLASPTLAIAVALAGFAAFALALRIDRGSAAPLFPKDAFRASRPVGAGLWVVLLMPMAQSSGSVFVVYGLQNLWGYAPTLAGSLNAIMALSWSAIAIVAASLSSRRLRLALIWIGPAMLILGLAGLVFAFWTGQIALLVVAQILVGGAFGACWGALSQAVMEAALEQERDRASALLPTAQSAGYAIGAALMGAIANMAGFASARAGAELQQAMVVVLMAGTALAIPALAAALRAAAFLKGRADVRLGS
ncbi:MFS transporter [Terrarubrum flagellatum]|uniref:MFS transporter n=1 Tax=Terrirubrum flagellatum TaxID=2895980 RepID=UPI003144DC44